MLVRNNREGERPAARTEMPMFSWGGVTQFVAAAEAESYTGAANRLEISTAQVSRQIGALETRLAVKLFYRTTRR